MSHFRLYHIAASAKPKSIASRNTPRNTPRAQNKAQRIELRAQNKARHYMWSRPELQALFALYGRMVIANHWRDYALGGEALEGRGGRASFHVFRHAAERPLYVIEKWTPPHGAPIYRIAGPVGQNLARHRELRHVLAWLQRQRIRLARTRRKS